MGRLAKKRCLIVGGTSGIGLAAARRFLQEGAALVVTGLTPGEVAVERDLAALGRIRVLPLDATKADEVAALFQAAIELLDGLDVLYHVAGGSGRKHGDGALHECTLAGWQATIDLNLKSTSHSKHLGSGRRRPSEARPSFAGTSWSGRKFGSVSGATILGSNSHLNGLRIHQLEQDRRRPASLEPCHS